MTSEGHVATIQEAARLLETTEGAIRKRVQRGSLKSERGEDGRVYVRVDTDETRRDESHDEGRTGRDDLLAAKDETIQLLRDQLAAERDANRENRRLLAAALERMPELEGSERREPSETEARTGADASGGTWPRTNDTSDSRSSQESAEDPPQRPWWRRILGGG